ncbi:Leucine-rich repeat transmembrane protein FLRT1 [Larimichthys crocea]|uniref:Uncharacterized protein n=1 Tax=Larimichthys crocea TaxID=215358 RepID=A0ACD3REC2_LARCR|nr:Leucine-rich repeat transmembrane protein FLRT1 [Larimichthys crocea]
MECTSSFLGGWCSLTLSQTFLLKQTPVKPTLRVKVGSPLLLTCGRTFHTEPRDWPSQRRLSELHTELCTNMAAESLAELRDWLFLLLLCLTLLAEVLELAAAAIAMETGEGDEGIVCPSVCRCDEGFVYCNDRGLSIIPPLPLMAAILYLQSNRLSNAGLPPSLERSTSIRVIYLYANQLDEFPIHLPPSLRELHLQDNNIRTLPRSALAKLPLLERLHLDDNSISTVSIQERAFSGTPRLRLLFLSRNHLSSIPAGLPASLEELRLDDNRISTIPTHAFRGLASLRRLVLDGNLLANTRIADDTFSRLSNLTELVVGQECPAVSTS